MASELTVSLQASEGLQRLSAFQLEKEHQSEPELLDVASKAIPLRRLGHKHDIGMACLFLTSGGADYITGETLVVDGGQWLAHQWISREDYDRIKSFRTPQAKL
jgi:NAD(P)-dependent dehydrogenase (short-subunit alcohol dehydrogenase family)